MCGADLSDLEGIEPDPEKADEKERDREGQIKPHPAKKKTGD